MFKKHGLVRLDCTLDTFISGVEINPLIATQLFDPIFELAVPHFSIHIRLQLFLVWIHRDDQSDTPLPAQPNDALNVLEAESDLPLPPLRLDWECREIGKELCFCRWDFQV
jgi:hypothetical protein